MVCNQCPRKCGAERPNGYCRQGDEIVILRAAPHFWEEPSISGTKGSGTIFFSGCSLGCVFCQNYDISHNGFGQAISTDRLCKIFKELEDQGVHNINLVNPTHYTSAIIRALEKYKPQIPVVWNSGGYERVETLRSLEGLVDIYLPDFKYIDSEISKKYSRAEDYFEYARTAVAEMVRQQGEYVFDGDIMQKGVIIRHLILPSNTQNSIDVLRFIKENYPGILVSLLAQYIPCGKAADYKELSRKITKREYDKVVSYMIELDLDGYVQELSSAAEKYIPPFDLTGV